MAAGIITIVVLSLSVILAIVSLILIKDESVKKFIVGFFVSVISLCLILWILGAASSLSAGAGSIGSSVRPSSQGPAAASSQDYNPSTGCAPYPQ